jgi:hypothetical protein
MTLDVAEAMAALAPKLAAEWKASGFLAELEGDLAQFGSRVSRTGCHFSPLF